MSEWITGLGNVLQPDVLLFLLGGLVIGVVIGALPGLSASMGIAIMTPVTFWFDPTHGFAMLIGLWNAAIFAGGISAILINTPGTPASIVTSFDGYSLYKQGKGGLALGINVIFSAIGGIFGSLALIFFAFPISRFAVRFGPPEFFSLALFGITMMISVSGNSVSKGLIMGFLGLLISTIGLDPIAATRRFTLGSTQLLNGINFLPVMIGMFGIGEVLTQIYEHRKSIEEAEQQQRKTNLALGRVLPTTKEFKSLLKPTLASAAVSTFIGAIPAAGAEVATLVCWGNAKKVSKHPEEYGKGSLEGLAVSTVANNAVLGGALTTMLTLGIPGDSVTAILIGSLMMYGMQPGSKIFTENRPFVINIMLLMILANLMFLILGLLTAKASAKALNVRQQTVWTAVCVLCTVGAFAYSNNFFEVLLMFACGIIGFFLRRGGYPAGPMILGILLGYMLESNLRRALVMSRGSYAIFFTRPVSCVLVLLTLFSLCLPFLKKHVFKKKSVSSAE